MLPMQDARSSSNTKQAIAGAVRAAMARRKISQKDLRTELGWTVSFLSRRVGGQVDLTVSELIAISEAISADPADIISVAIEDAQRSAVAA